MGGIVQNVTELIGGTPMMRLGRLSQAYGCRTPILAKLEGYNPGGSVKDRAALSMLGAAAERGEIGPETTVVEATSGNMGVALAVVCAGLGLKCLIVTPEDPGRERRKTLEALGAELIFSPPSEGMQGARARAEQLARERKDTFVPRQFHNDDNCRAHRENTAREIIEAVGRVDYFVAGVGTGGTLTGCGEALKRRYFDCQVIAVEPVDSPVLSGGFPGAHQLQGIGAGFVPDILNEYIIDEIIRVRTPDTFELTRALAREQGLICGISSGAALAAAVEVARRPEAEGKTLVTILPDTGLLYLSSELYG